MHPAARRSDQVRVFHDDGGAVVVRLGDRQWQPAAPAAAGRPGLQAQPDRLRTGMAQRADERDLMTPDSEALREATERPRPDSADVGQFATDANRSDPSGREGLATDSAVGAAYDEAAESVDEHQSQGRE